MCTVTGYDEDAGYTIRLDEYDIADGLLAIHELSNKKIKKNTSSYLKIGTQYPLEVIECGTDGGGRPFLSKKNVKPREEEHCRTIYGLNKRLYGLPRRLAAMTEVPAETWTEKFQSVTWPGIAEADHPMTLIYERKLDGQDGLDVHAEYLSMIDKCHAKLFGIKPVTAEYAFDVQSFAIDGAKRIADSLIRIRDSYGSGNMSNEELYHNNQAVNVEILPTAIPTFTVKVTAYQRERCQEALGEIKKLLLAEGYDYLTDG